MIELKSCLRCGHRKPLGDFNHYRRSPDLRQPYCRACQRDYRLDNHAHALQHDRYRKTPTKSREYYVAHAEALKAKRRARYAASGVR